MDYGSILSRIVMKVKEPTAGEPAADEERSVSPLPSARHLARRRIPVLPGEPVPIEEAF